MKALYCKCAGKWGEYAPLVLRVVVGLSFMLHGWQKLNEMGIDKVAGFFDSVGIPMAGFFAVVVTWLELLGGAALIVGLFTHWFSKLLAINMLVALFTVHMGKGFFVGDGGPELVLILLGACVSLMITGAGPISLDRHWRKETE